ncbi:MAG: hypothetical protein ACK5OB_19920 [Pirellula sp.]
MDTHHSTASKPSSASMVFSAGTYFIHFMALGFGSFPLQTHLRQTLSPATASLITSVIPLAACLTYFFFRFAERQGWTRSPQRLLVAMAGAVCLMQLALGWKLQSIAADSWWLGPGIDAAVCLLLLGCVQSSCMTLLNHIGVATMGSHAYTVRAAGSAGYMLAVILLGAIGASEQRVSEVHLYVGAAFSLFHMLFAMVIFSWMQRVDGTLARNEAVQHREASGTGQESHLGEHAPVHRTTPLRWWGLLALVWMVAMCEMSYGLYAHEFLTTTYGSAGYFVFAGSIALEIALLLVMPVFPALKQRLLFVGPVGWMTLMAGCLMALSGWPAMGFCAAALALNCPFQVSANEHAHRMSPSLVGLASMTLAQSIGYMSATILSALLSVQGGGPVRLWSVMVPVASTALLLAFWQMAKDREGASNPALAPR